MLWSYNDTKSRNLDVFQQLEELTIESRDSEKLDFDNLFEQARSDELRRLKVNLSLLVEFSSSHVFAPFVSMYEFGPEHMFCFEPISSCFRLKFLIFNFEINFDFRYSQNRSRFLDYLRWLLTHLKNQFSNQKSIEVFCLHLTLNKSQNCSNYGTTLLIQEFWNQLFLSSSDPITELLESCTNLKLVRFGPRNVRKCNSLDEDLMNRLKYLQSELGWKLL